MKAATMTPAIDTSIPVLLLGGEANALEVARHFGRHGIDVRISGPTGTDFAVRGHTPPPALIRELS